MTALTRARRRIGWLIEDIQGVWSVMTAIPWWPDNPTPPATGYVAPHCERILPDPPLSRDALAVNRVINRAIDGATPDELDRLLLECLNEGGDAA